MTKRERCIRAACETEPNNAKQYPCEYPTCICAKDFEKRIDAIFAELEKPDEAMIVASLDAVIWPDMPAGGDPEEICNIVWQSRLQAAAGGGDG